jgi:hypothetical protein
MAQKKAATKNSATSKKTTGKKAPSKNSAASLSLNQKVNKLLELASGAPKQTLKQRRSTAKLFELVVLADILQIYEAQFGKGSVRIKNVTGNILHLGGAPCSADKTTFSYFELLNSPGGTTALEAWVSVEVTTLSWKLSGLGGTPPRSGKHEIDVGIFEPIPPGTLYPDYEMLRAAFSCKHFDPLKESVREALGLRRETALLVGDEIDHTAVPWLISNVPTRPPSPLFLVSSSAGVYAYQDPVDKLGVYMMCVPFTY